ncbi:MAG: translation initiation factor IF-2 N-terminal domain-containing protein [Actinobacteria bacterium]|nr:translation initiation factor IF-2 N-terminal domain-containing protein [Actinomycetota bacterium]
MATKKIRIHELAKELGMTNTEVLDLCGVLGVAAKGPPPRRRLHRRRPRLRRLRRRRPPPRRRQPRRPQQRRQRKRRSNPTSSSATRSLPMWRPKRSQPSQCPLRTRPLKQRQLQPRPLKQCPLKQCRLQPRPLKQCPLKQCPLKQCPLKQRPPQQRPLKSPNHRRRLRRSNPSPLLSPARQHNLLRRLPPRRQNPRRQNPSRRLRHNQSRPLRPLRRCRQPIPRLVSFRARAQQLMVARPRCRRVQFLPTLA